MSQSREIVVRRQARTFRAARLTAIACGLAFGLACGGKARSERRGGGGGGPSTTGGTTAGGFGGSSGNEMTGGRSNAGSTGVGGNAGAGGRGNGGDGGLGGDGGSGGDAAAGGDGGAGNCVDVCALHGAACCIANVECVDAETRCTVEVLANQVSISYDYATLEQRIAALPQDLLLSFTDADVAWAAAEPAPAARIELHMTSESAALHRDALEFATNNPFRVSCDGQLLFVGVVYRREGEAALDTPVLHAALDEEDSLILRLGARQGAWMGLGAIEAEARLRIDRAELRAALCLRGALREL